MILNLEEELTNHSPPSLENYLTLSEFMKPPGINFDVVKEQKNDHQIRSMEIEETSSKDDENLNL